jgi:hypothetical protein
MTKLRFYLVGLLLALLPYSVSCSNKEAATLQFDYNLQQQTYQANLVSPLQLQIKGDNLDFTIFFTGGGGSYDKARLEQSNKKLQIILFDKDGKLQNMRVIYHLSGSISSLEPGKYELQIENSEGTKIAEDTFVIQ